MRAAEQRGAHCLAWGYRGSLQYSPVHSTALSSPGHFPLNSLLPYSTSRNQKRHMKINFFSLCLLPDSLDSDFLKCNYLWSSLEATYFSVCLFQEHPQHMPTQIAARRSTFCISKGRGHPCSVTWGLRCSGKAATLLPLSWKITSFSCIRTQSFYCTHPSASPLDSRETPMGSSRWKPSYPQSNEGPSASPALCWQMCHGSSGSGWGLFLGAERVKQQDQQSQFQHPSNCPLQLLMIVCICFQEATVRTGHGTTDWFQIGKAVQKGCMFSPCLFNFYAEYIMQDAGLDEAQAGIKIAGRNINNFRYADDTALMAESKE